MDMGMGMGVVMGMYQVHTYVEMNIFVRKKFTSDIGFRRYRYCIPTKFVRYRIKIAQCLISPTYWIARIDGRIETGIDRGTDTSTPRHTTEFSFR